MTVCRERSDIPDDRENTRLRTRKRSIVEENICWINDLAKIWQSRRQRNFAAQIAVGSGLAEEFGSTIVTLIYSHKYDLIIDFLTRTRYIGIGSALATGRLHRCPRKRGGGS
jgi:hypothetical protein